MSVYLSVYFNEFLLRHYLVVWKYNLTPPYSTDNVLCNEEQENIAGHVTLS